MSKRIMVEVQEVVVSSFFLSLDDLFNDEDFPKVINPDSILAIWEWMADDVDRQIIADECGDANFDYCEDREIISAKFVDVG